jgi:ParB/RepB/Spo0J family partition protein
MLQDPPEDSPSARLVARARLALAKRQSESVFERWRQAGPQAEQHTKNLYSTSELIEVGRIVEDKDFVNFRANIDPIRLAELQTSIELEGLRTPITVACTMPPGRYYVRAGFRRIAAVRNLGWKEIPAIVLPANTPKSEEYWTNIIENTNREKLSAYEIAAAAKMMRDRFGVTGSAFAHKSGHSPDYVLKLLSCIDRLPGEVLHSWKRGDRVPFEIYFKLSTMTGLEAIKNLRLWMGQHRISSVETQVEEAFKRLKKHKGGTDKLLTVRGIERTQRLITAIRVSKLSPREKDLCQQIVEYCQGGRRRVDGIVNDWKHAGSQTFTNHETEAPLFDDLDLENKSMVPITRSDELEDHKRNMERTFREMQMTVESPDINE